MEFEGVHAFPELSITAGLILLPWLDLRMMAPLEILPPLYKAPNESAILIGNLEIAPAVFLNELIV